jgi:hypothetical protein
MRGAREALKLSQFLHLSHPKNMRSLPFIYRSLSVCAPLLGMLVARSHLIRTANRGHNELPSVTARTLDLIRKAVPLRSERQPAGALMLIGTMLSERPALLSSQIIKVRVHCRPCPLARTPQIRRKGDWFQRVRTDSKDIPKSSLTERPCRTSAASKAGKPRLASARHPTACCPP